MLETKRKYKKIWNLERKCAYVSEFLYGGTYIEAKGRACLTCSMYDMIYLFRMICRLVYMNAVYPVRPKESNCKFH